VLEGWKSWEAIESSNLILGKYDLSQRWHLLKSLSNIGDLVLSEIQDL
jgi:hypothetical protein